MKKEPEKLDAPLIDQAVKADPERVAAAEKTKATKFEKVKHVGPCGEENPCGGGFGA